MIGGKKQKVNKNRNDKAAFSLIEILVSVSLFVVIIISTTSIFKLSIDAQRNSISSQNVQESLKYFLEVVAKEMRMAQKDRGDCSGDPGNSNKVFIISGDNHILSFKNSYGECVTYRIENLNGVERFLVNRRLTDGSVNREDFISPGKINIDSLKFYLKGSYSDNSQEMITINLKASATDEDKFKSEMVIQTSVTSRYYK